MNGKKVVEKICGYSLPIGCFWNAETVNGKKQGLVEVRNEKNLLIAKLQYIDDMLNGICEFYENGILVRDYVFINDVADGWGCEYNKDGSKIFCFYEDGIRMSEVKDSKNGNKCEEEDYESYNINSMKEETKGNDLSKWNKLDYAECTVEYHKMKSNKKTASKVISNPVKATSNPVFRFDVRDEYDLDNIVMKVTELIIHEYALYEIDDLVIEGYPYLESIRVDQGVGYSYYVSSITISSMII